MKLICDGLDLADAVLKVSRAVNNKIQGGSLEVIKLCAKGDSLILTATDTELTLEKTIKADVYLEGEILVSAKVFPEFVKRLSKERIEINLIKDYELKIKYKDNEGFFQVMGSANFPLCQEVSEENSFSVIEKEFKELINKTVFCALTDDTRPLLKSCLFEIANHTIASVALDGFRMALCKRAVENATKEYKVIVPSKTLKEISALLPGSDEILTVFVEKSYIKLKINNLVITSRLLEGEYINYNQIVPASFTSEVTFNKKEMEECLDRIILLASSNNNTYVKLDIKEMTMHASANSEAGNAYEYVNINLKGKDIVIAFNGAYLLEAVKSINDDFIKMHINASNTPCTLTPIKDNNLLYLLLPIRLN